MSLASRYAHTFRLPVERRVVFALFADPRYLDFLTPPWFRLRPIGDLPERLGAGSEISYRLRWRGLHFRWTSRMTDWRAPEFFAYEQLQGPYQSFRHEHLFADVASGTEVRDRVIFRAPGGRFTDRWIAAPDLERIFAFRERRARELFSRTAVLPPRYELPGDPSSRSSASPGPLHLGEAAASLVDRPAISGRPDAGAHASAATAGAGASRMPWTSASSSAIERPT